MGTRAELNNRIIALIDAIDHMPPSKIGCDGMLIVPVERYNKVVQQANKLLKESMDG